MVQVQPEGELVLAPSPLWSGAEITTLLDGQATKTGIQDALGAIAAKADPADTFLFYYAGHGGASGSNVYIFPADTTWETAGFTGGVQNPQVLDGCEGEVRVKGE